MANQPKVLITGSSGFLGKAVTNKLTTKPHAWLDTNGKKYKVIPLGGKKYWDLTKQKYSLNNILNSPAAGGANFVDTFDFVTFC